MQPILEVRRLRKSFGSLEVVRGVELTLRPGEVVFIIGPSGSGKSTFIRCLNFLEEPDEGEIVFDGAKLCWSNGAGFSCAPERVLRAARAKMPMVFQSFNLFRHRTVLENVIEGPITVRRQTKQEAIAKARQILDMVGLSDKTAAYPAQLSGGQQQRVGIARALAMEPKLILLDEPTSSLDPELVSGVLETIRGLAEKGMTMIIVTHEMAFARNLADTVYFMSDGIFLECGPPSELFEAPSHDRLKTFIQSMLT
jgi:ABC-type polar amino acid transport system ATPase subunit